MSEQDLLVLQTGAALLPPTLFLTTCADRFRLIDYFHLHIPLGKKISILLLALVHHVVFLFFLLSFLSHFTSSSHPSSPF
jgi:hypothetical protein